MDNAALSRDTSRQAEDMQVELWRRAEALEGCGLRYLAGGSLASSLSGEPRSTLDVDLVVSMSESDVQPFVDRLGDEFYAEPDSLRRAIRDRSSTNIIHYTTSMKVDMFIVGGSVLDEQQMNRRQRIQVTTDPDRHLYFYTPEDILLQKLSWYRAGTNSHRSRKMKTTRKQSSGL